MTRMWPALIVALSACNGAEEPSGDTDGSAGPFDGVAPVSRYYEPMADATWQTVEGEEISVSGMWSPGDVLVVYAAPDAGYHEQVLGGDWEQLLLDMPRRAQLVFSVYAEGAARRQERLDALVAARDAALAAMDEARRSWWSDRIHILRTPPKQMGWVAELGAPNVRRTGNYHDGQRFVGFLVDPRQQIRPLGELVDWANSRPRIEWLAHEVKALRHEADVLAAAESVPAEIVTVLDGEGIGTGWGGAGVFAEVALPDDLAHFEGLELDMNLSCFHVEPGGETDELVDNVGDLNCPEWDRIVHLDLCTDETGESCFTELGRWITAYTKDGHWIHDVSPLLPLLAEVGDTAWFRIRSIDNYRTFLSLRFIDDDTRPRPLATVPLYDGGQLHAETNDRYAQPVDVAVPAEADRAEIVAAITGHSFGKDTKNCGEFCDHQHTFSVGGVSVQETHPTAGTSYGCADAVGEGSGVVANQYGSWPFGRAGWCPGAPVDLWRADVTAGVVAGQTASVAYEVAVDGGPYQPVWLEPAEDGDADNIWDGDGLHPEGVWVPEYVLRSWLVSYAAPTAEE